MKKIAIVLSLLLVLSICLTACTSPNKSQSNESQEDKLKVVLLIPGTLGDKSFFDSANAGMELVKK